MVIHSLWPIIQKTTPKRRFLTKVRNKLVSRHLLEMLITRVIRICYPRNMQYLGYKIRSNYDTCTSECRSKLRHKGIDGADVDQASLEFPIKGFPSTSLNDLGQSSVREIRQNDLAFRMTTTVLKFSKKSFLGFHHGTGCEMEQVDQKRMTWNHEEGSKPEWIFSVQVLYRGLSEREREREETEHKFRKER